ncbi:MAG: hypothetical protein U9P10_04970 [Thermodesulfobacteriota bacterium]|nr:hypothetical protein [Thermodesulfobacteriota bacterium]
MKKKFQILIYFFVLVLYFSYAHAQLTAPVLSVEINGLRVNLSWNIVPGAQGYLLYYAPMPYGGPETIQEANMGNIRAFPVTLWEGASFIVAVKAYAAGSISGFSNAEIITVENQQTTGDNSLADLLLKSDLSLAKEFGSALAVCAPQSHNTTPDHWGEVAILGGSQLCSVWTPPGWNALRMGEGVNLLYEDPSGNTTLTMAGGTTFEVSDCSFNGINAWWLGKIAQGGCSRPNLVWSREFSMDVAGTQIPTSLFLVTCNKNGLEIAGLFQSQIHSQDFLCQFRMDGYMLPRNDISKKVSTLSQILNSTKCREKNQNFFKCTKPDCSTRMKQQGYQGGYCNSLEECVPVQ